jgi:hypothetical protein
MFEQGIDYDGLRKSIILEKSAGVFSSAAKKVGDFFTKATKSKKDAAKTGFQRMLSSTTDPSKATPWLLGSAGLSGAILLPNLKEQLDQKKMPLHEQLLSKNTALGETTRIAGIGLGAMLAAQAAHSIASSRQHSNI